MSEATARLDDWTATAAAARAEADEMLADHDVVEVTSPDNADLRHTLRTLHSRLLCTAEKAEHAVRAYRAEVGIPEPEPEAVEEES